MSELVNFLVGIVTMGVGTLFVTFLIILNERKEELWGEIYERISIID